MVKPTINKVAERLMDEREAGPKHLINVRQILKDRGIARLNMETIFGENDEIVCEDCSTVFSPAAYFVDLLQFLRATLSVKGEAAAKSSQESQQGTAKVKKPGSLEGTALECLLRRRPDLEHIELSCVNTETILPYVDLVNEVMESFIVNLRKFEENSLDPKQCLLKVYNSKEIGKDDEIWQPQNTNNSAYAYLAHAVFPIRLPYNRPLDVACLYLDFLGINLGKLLGTLRPVLSDTEAGPDIKRFHQERLDRRADATALGLLEEEYVILTSEAFASQIYYEAVAKRKFSVGEYHALVGIVPIAAYYGYGNQSQLESTDQEEKTGLCWVKDQFLRRTGITWVQLVDVMQTSFVNHGTLSGSMLKMLREFRVSYRFLMTLVDPSRKGNRRFEKVGKYIASLTQGSSKLKDELSQWTEAHFHTIGKLIVPESNDGPHLQDMPGRRLENGIYVTPVLKAGAKEPPPNKRPLTKLSLCANGLLVDEESGVAGHVDAEGHLRALSSEDENPTILDKFKQHDFSVFDSKQAMIGNIAPSGVVMFSQGNTKITWAKSLTRGGASSIDNVMLVHLNGSALEPNDWTAIHRFIRLWKKMGLSITEVDMALTGLTVASSSPDPTPDFIHQLIETRKVVDLTGFSIEKALTLWAPIPTRNPGSLYQRLFFKRQIPDTTNVFAADEDGLYLTNGDERLSGNKLLLNACLGLRPNDNSTALGSTLLPLDDILDIENVLALYRYTCLYNILEVSMTQLSALFGIFDRPLSSPSKSLDLLQTWAKIKEAEFTFDELDYIIGDDNLSTKRLKVDRIKVMITCRQLQEDLRVVSEEQQDLQSDADVDAVLVRAKTHLFYDEAGVEKIMQHLDGSAQYSVNAPNGLSLGSMPETLKLRIKYLDTRTPDKTNTAKLQITGVLSQAGADLAVSLLKNDGVIPGSSDSFDNIKIAWKSSFEDALVEAKDSLEDTVLGEFAKDDPVFLQPKSEMTNAAKYKLFLDKFMPYLRLKLSKGRIVDVMKTFGNVKSTSLTASLLKTVVSSSKNQMSIERSLMRLADLSHQQSGANNRKGFLLPPLTEDYIFYVASKTKPAGFYLDGRSIDFKEAYQGSQKLFSAEAADPIRLEAWRLYRMDIYGV